MTQYCVTLYLKKISEKRRLQYNEMQTYKIRKRNYNLIQRSLASSNIYTYNKALQNRPARFSKQNPKCVRLVTAYPCGAVTYEVDKKQLSIRFTSTYSEERRARARNYAIKNNIISNIDNRHKESI